MTEEQRGFIARIRAHAEEVENYNAGWDVVTEAFTDSELLELIGGETEEEHDRRWAAWRDMAPPRILPAATYEEAFAMVKEHVDIYDEQRRAAQNEVF